MRGVVCHDIDVFQMLLTLSLYHTDLQAAGKLDDGGTDSDFVTMNHIRNQRDLEEIDAAAAIANNISWKKDAKSTTRDPQKRTHAELNNFSPRASWWPNVSGKIPIFFTVSLSLPPTTIPRKLTSGV